MSNTIGWVGLTVAVISIAFATVIPAAWVFSIAGGAAFGSLLLSPWVADRIRRNH